MDNETYRNEFRQHFIGQMKNSKFPVNKAAAAPREHRPLTYESSPTHTTSKSSRHHHNRDYNVWQQQKIADYEAACQRRQQQQQQLQKQLQQRRSSGGDADRAIYESNFALQHPAAQESYRRNNDSTSYTMHPMTPKTIKEQPLTAPAAGTGKKYKAEEPPAYMYETDSNLGGGSEESVKSQKSSITVVTLKSSRELREMVKSQCKLHEVIDETLKNMCGTDGELNSEDGNRDLKEQPPQLQQLQTHMPMSKLHCKRCTDKGQGLSRSSQKDVMTEIAKGDFLDCRSGDTLTISVDDVVNSKVINPMIRKLQRMYLNNLKEEMSLMEDLERLPHKVNEVYKATIFKQKD